MRFLVKFLVAVWALLLLGGVASAAPVVGLFGAIGTFLASGTILANLAITALLTAVRIGISLLTKAKEKERESGVQGQVTFGGTTPMTFIMGSFASAGHLEYAGTWGNSGKTPNAYYTFVHSVSDLPLDLTGIWIDDTKVTWPTGHANLKGPSESIGAPIAQFTKGGTPYLWVKYLDGTQTETDGFLLNKFASAEKPIDSTMIWRGVPLVIVTARVSEDLFNGLPQAGPKETLGMKLYDPRKDSSVGGSGSHRWNNPATWEPSSNPIVQIYNIKRGIHYNGVWLWGGRCEAWQLPLANWFPAMNACDLAISLKGGGTEPQYRSGIEVSVDQQPVDVEEDILKSCCGRIAEIGGVYKVQVGALPAPVFTFTDAHLIVTQGSSLEPFPGIDQAYNGARASYPSPAEKWGAKDSPVYVSATYLADDDGQEKIAGMQLPTVISPTQVQRILKAVVDDGRFWTQHQIVLPPEAWFLEPAIDVIAWSSDRFGYSNKKFVISEMQGSSSFVQVCNIKAVDNAGFDWDPETEEKPTPIAPIGSVVPAPQPMTGWQVFPATLKDDNGTDRRPSIEVRMDGDQDDVSSVWIQVRIPGDDLLHFDGRMPYDDPDFNPNPKSIILNGQFMPNVLYEVRGKFVPFSDRVTEWSDWLPVTTPDVRLGADDIYIDASEIIGILGDMMEQFGNSIRDVEDQIAEIDAAMAAATLQAYSNVAEVRQEVGTTFGDAVATFQERITAATGPNSALVARIENFNVSLEGKSDIEALRSIQLVTTNANGVITGVGQAVTSIAAQLPGKANISALQSIGLVVTNSGGAITGVGSAVTSITAQLPGKANITALQSIGIVTTDINGQISGVGTAITGIQAQINGITTQALFRAEAGYVPGAGYTARIGIEARISSLATFRAAGLYIDVNASAARLILNADQVAIMAGGTIAALFASGTTFIANARIRDLTADNIKVKSLNADVVFLDGTIITELFAFSSVTSRGTLSGSGGPGLTTSWASFKTLVIANPNPNPVLMQVNLSVTASDAGAGAVSHMVRLINLTTGAVLATASAIIAPESGSQSASGSFSGFIIDDSPVSVRGNYTYALQRITSGAMTAGVASGTVKMLWWKR